MLHRIVKFIRLLKKKSEYLVKKPELILVSTVWSVLHDFLLYTFFPRIKINDIILKPQILT